MSDLVYMTTNMADEQPAEPVPEAPTEEGTTPAGDAAPEEAPPAEAPAEAPAEEPAEAAEGDAPAETTETPGEGEAAPPETAPAEEGTTPAGDGEAPPTQEGDASPAAEGEATPAPEGEPTPAPEGETPAAGEEGAPTEGEGGATPAEGEQPAAEGEQPPEGEGPTEGESVPAEGGEPQAEGEAAPEGTPKPEGEAAAEGEGAPEGEQTEGQEAPEGEAAEGKPQSPLPQSDTFAEGERPESPVAVGEKLSREGSPAQAQEGEPGPEVIRPSTPEREATETQMREDTMEILEEEEGEDLEEEPMYNREELIESYQASIAKREELQQQNYQLQHKLAEYFRKKKSDDSNRQDQQMDKNVTDQEQRYLKYMSNLEELRKQDYLHREDYKMQIEDLKNTCQNHQADVDEDREKYLEYKKQVALNAINTRTGKPTPPRDIEHILSQENKKEAEVVNVRLENIKLKNKLKKKEQQLKSKEELAAGLHMIDFEQLKIENQTYNEKIEERNEELLKLRKKITSTVQVLTHLKEKLQFVQAENQVLKSTLRDVDDRVAKKRDILSRTKQARDALRIDNQRLRQNCGLLGNEPLLRDFEDRKDETDELKQKLEALKLHHAELTLNTTSVRRKLEQARSGRT